ncbi:hypothetical protein ACL02U_02965 [Streptomyces sp. MS06]|uniref:hypothetical protein n=1 Tax=Streptomyces sp. MS06 TaxID=3385974 RepID=UPI0039A2E495
MKITWIPWWRARRVAELKRLNQLVADGDFEAAEAGARALHGLGRRAEAEAAARLALTDCERSLHPSHPRTGTARALLTRITAAGPPGDTAAE